MNLPPALKKALAITGLASALTGTSFAEQKPTSSAPSKPKGEVSVTIDVTKLPKIFNTHTGEYQKELDRPMTAAAVKACRDNGLNDWEQVKVTAIDKSGDLDIRELTCDLAKDLAKDYMRKPSTRSR